MAICVGESTTLTATGGTTFNWSTTPPQTTAAITVSPTTTTTYTVTVTNANGCTDTEAATVVVSTNNSPTALCKNITIFLNNLGENTITGQQVDNGSSSGCLGGPLTYAVNPNFFACNDLSINGSTVVLTVTNSSGSTASCSAVVTVNDTIAPVIACPANVTVNCANFNGLGSFPGATATDNCPGPVVTVQVISATNACDIGTITRTFTASDSEGNEDECTQLIVVTGPTDPLKQADIDFPADITLNSCTSTLPAVTGNTIVHTENATCTNVTVSYTDVNLDPNTPCNFTIERTWRVVDSCQLNGAGAGIFLHVQLITVNDNMAPTITGYTDATFTSTTSCTVTVNYNMSGVSITDCGAVTVTNNSPFATNPNSGNPSGVYDEGIYNVIITATDGCGNIARDTVKITVIANNTPAFVCQKVIRSINDQGFVDILADEHVVSVGGLCPGQVYQISYSQTDITDTIKRYTCDELGDHTLFLHFWVDGVYIDSCKTLATILDPAGFCTGNIFRVTGDIHTENNEPVKGFVLTFDDGTGPVIITDDEGKYNFPEMESQGDYMIKPSKNDGILEGVSTLDLVMIQRHILGSLKLNSAYKMIAADVNNDNKITAADLVELRKVILGLSDKFKNNTSWKSIDGKYTFPDQTRPFDYNYPLYHQFFTPKGNMIADFIGVKIGDVNNSFVANANNQSKPRGSAAIEMKGVNAGQNEELKLDVQLIGINETDGLQLEFDVTGMTSIKVSSKYFNENELQYHYLGNKLYVNVITSETRVLGDATIFTITGISTIAGYASDMIGLTNTYLENEVYVNLVPVAVDQRWVNDASNDFDIAQNKPNPWNDRTMIDCTVPGPGYVDMKISDVSGKVLVSRKVEVAKGHNLIEISSDKFEGSTGIFLYEIKFGGKTMYGKMIRIK